VSRRTAVRGRRAARAEAGDDRDRPAGLAGDRGSVTVLAATAIGVTVLLLAVGVALGATVAARHRAEHAADLAALGAAADAVSGRDLGCGRARELAAANGARLQDCRWSGWEVEVRVAVTCHCLPSVADTVVGRARAGPSVRFATSNAEASATARDGVVTVTR
jgi:secretion/DNA translocation related TadE-like protein